MDRIVKQEIAKEGILPFSKFFARNRLWRWAFWRRADMNTYENPEATPVGALLLHWLFAIILIMSTFSLSPTAAYKTYVGMYSFTIDAVFAFLVGLGLLILRIFEGKTRWSKISRENKWISIICATIYTIGNLYPICAIWVPPTKLDVTSDSVSFWITGTVGLSTLTAGCLYWIVIRYVGPWILQSEFEVERLIHTGNEGGEVVVINEVVTTRWKDHVVRRSR